ncbi:MULTISPECIES: PepSY domain-containing protein [Ureibacillus]|jgi:uncharacterized membrane protein YkoI|uniref:Putative membrane protein YkoI n=1 Tax=Ureibacillus thermosphaericus TaxID=51173 RepID=A0A840PYB5_URETH|nr:PepSY domain-containing protein [Ureibacillus thermosphaericus]MBB5149681.1 putative membrane protein YkoI [Ureibacillus thermosphaericus]NKZ32475.1 hypothetical protein [Ureibacillus thermosphaericus]
MIKKLIIAGFTLSLLAACSTNAKNITTEVNTTNNSNESTIAQNESNITNPVVTMREAIDIFKEAYPDAKIESIDLESDFGQLYYDIDGYDSTKEYEVEIDATTKEIKVNEVESKVNRDEALDFSNIIEPNEAIEKAATNDEVKDLSPIGWSLEVERGKPIYTIEYKNQTQDIDIKIDGTTGEMIQMKMDD